jgi:hypothetical protein
MSEENEHVAVRHLPDGTPQPGLLKSLKGNLLQIGLTSDATNRELPPGALVEVGGDHALYLGEVQGCRDSVVIVAVEHAINRTSLSALQDVWHCSQEA